MRTCVYDIEADNLLVKASVVYCVVVYDCETAEYFQYGPTEIEAAYRKLQEYDVCWGHNVLGFDKPCLEKFYAARLGPLPTHDDTFMRSRLMWGPTDSPAGRHGLEAWGLYFKYPKIHFKDWSKFTDEMMIYCRRDVEINVKVKDYIVSVWDSKLDRALKLETRVRALITKQELNGFRLDPDLQDGFHRR